MRLRKSSPRCLHSVGTSGPPLVTIICKDPLNLTLPLFCSVPVIHIHVSVFALFAFSNQVHASFFFYCRLCLMTFVLLSSQYILLLMCAARARVARMHLAAVTRRNFVCTELFVHAFDDLTHAQTHARTHALFLPFFTHDKVPFIGGNRENFPQS